MKNLLFTLILMVFSLLFSTKVYAFCPGDSYNATSSVTFDVNCTVTIDFIPTTSSDTVTINSGVTLSSPSGYPFETGAHGGNLVNNGTMASGIGSIMLYYDFGTITNTGTISKGTHYGAITNYGYLPQITEITNTGTIQTGTTTRTINGVTFTIPGIYNTAFESNSNSANSGTITTLNPLQGGNAPLTFLGRVPTNYNIIINSTSNFGKLSLVGEVLSFGITTFGIYTGSTIAAGTYEDVLIGFLDTEAGLTSLTGTYGAYNWELVLDASNNYDLVFTSSRSPYNSRVISSNLTTFATHLETMRTNGRKVALTDILDGLTDDQFNTALKKMKGATSNITNNQSLNAQSNFRTAQSIMTSPVATSKVTNLTKTNAGNLTLADLKYNQLHASIQPAKFLTDNNFFNQETNQSSIGVLEFFKSNKNTSIIDKDFNERGFYLKTFGSTSNYAAINNDDNGYNSDTYGFFGGISNKIDENLYQGYSLGFSRSKLTLDADEGNSKTNTIHASIHRNLDDKDYALGASLGAYISSVDNIRNISETSEVLKSSPTNGGLDLQLEYVKKMNLFGLNFYPSVSLTTSYGIIKDYRETGGVGSALHVKSDNVLVIKPEIGFTLENNFVQTEKITQGANFSLFASRQQYLDGHSTTTSLIDENFSNSNTLPKTKNHFLTAGIGYVAKNIDEKSDLNFNFFFTQSTNNALNSSLFSISYNKVF